MNNNKKTVPLKELDLVALKAYNTGEEQVIFVSEKELQQWVGGIKKSAKDFRILRRFFNGKNYDNKTVDLSKLPRNKNGEVVLTHKEMVHIFYAGAKKTLLNAAYHPLLNYSGYLNDIDESYYAARAFTFGSIGVTFDTEKIRYIIDKNGNPRIENFGLLIDDDNFDYNSDSYFAKPVNAFLKPVFSDNIENKIIIKIDRDYDRKYDDYSSQSFNNLSRTDKSILSTMKDVLTFIDIGAEKYIRRGFYLYNETHKKPRDWSADYYGMDQKEVKEWITNLRKEREKSGEIFGSYAKASELGVTLSKKSQNGFYIFPYQPTGQDHTLIEYNSNL
ncbi:MULTISPECIES: hypothetical protein [Pasteurellaceae]|uniref:Uncharacterized protein n=1 Tax=Pasteurella atlantica TaxID=2827233 RepID=A0AAW8CH70_9PAST|nr:hypothetical protein [Pasteurella atlantica]MBR0573430.1 hypothetical protein [Pasteurella atlantica]MDP8039431.1 hypothetical protein [Pasteurella atlantica]MDP8041522.1 hypothetical protein [Pasteurella atlantica]MDP8043659.1 hypothetical protein [Pasteurella atlantica]MDP8045844.1 hypothetical protein [Pasteurella atlantica]